MTDLKDIQEGQVAIIALPQRGRAAKPIPQDEIKALLANLKKVSSGEGVTNGRFYEKSHQAQSYGKRLVDALGEADAQYRDRLGLSVIPSDKSDNGKPIGPFVLAVRKK